MEGELSKKRNQRRPPVASSEFGRLALLQPLDTTLLLPGPRLAGGISAINCLVVACVVRPSSCEGLAHATHRRKKTVGDKVSKRQAPQGGCIVSAVHNRLINT